MQVTVDLFSERGAVLSDCKKYRYLLWRTWETDKTKPRALFVMLNPSTADAEVDDATIRSCVRLCKSWGYGSLEVVNLFAWRATDPTELKKQPDRLGPENWNIVGQAISRCDTVVCAWGAHEMAEKAGADLRAAVLRKKGIYCLGKTKAGAPKHPLYVKTGTELQPYTV